MARKAKKQKVHKTQQEAVYVPALANQSCRIVQITSVGAHLYGLDERGRVFAYVEKLHGWYQIEGDSQRFVLKRADEIPPTVGPAGNGNTPRGAETEAS